MRFVGAALAVGVLLSTLGCWASPTAPQPVATINPFVTFETTTIEETEYDQVAQPITLLEFYAEWCAVCKRTAPLVQRLRKEFGDRVIFASYDVDQPASAEWVRAYRVVGVPTYVLLDGKQTVLARISGAFDYATMRARLERYTR
ncbi:MAG: thioredoxin domain-containing protein [Thermoflexales bacterium]|nr:thioredoxin domain-containing protein [Thermoflexales bacterium]MCX7939086.1 thioredoxin domain-containing protein [Thermoflexales bacterium]